MSTYHSDLKKKDPYAAKMRALAGAPGVCRRNMIRALKMLPALNTPEDDERLKAALWCNRHGI